MSLGHRFATYGTAELATMTVLTRNSQAATVMSHCHVGSGVVTLLRIPELPVPGYGAPMDSNRLEASTLRTFRDAVRWFVEQVPKGRVVTYGDVATWVGRPGAARQVGAALRSLAAENPTFPWQRVINAQGGISTFKVGTGELQIALLRAEGVDVQDGTVDLSRYRFALRDDAPAGERNG